MGSTTSSPEAEISAGARKLPDFVPSEALVKRDEAPVPLRKEVVRELQSSYCKEFGKDKVIFLSRDDWEKPPETISSDFLKRVIEEDTPRGVILPNGEINWGCPCLGNLAYGPCASSFREAFSCFHFSVADPKGSDCLEQFRDMTECMSKYPNLYPLGGDDDDEENEEDAFATIDKAEKQAESEKRNKDSPSTKQRK